MQKGHRTILAWGAGAMLLAAILTGASSASAARTPFTHLLREYGFGHQTASWTSRVVITDEDGTAKNSDSQCWIKGDKYRIEARDAEKREHVMLFDGTEFYVIDPESNLAYRWSEAMSRRLASVDFDKMMSDSLKQRKTARRVGSEVVDGKTCNVYAYRTTRTEQGGIPSDVRECIWKKDVFPVKMEVKTPRHQLDNAFLNTTVPASTMVITIQDLVTDRPVDDSLFSVPAGMQVKTLDLPVFKRESPAAEPREDTRHEEKRNASDEESNSEKPAVDLNKVLNKLF